MEKPILLKVTGVRKKFIYPKEVEILKGIDLEVRAGESVAITGLSGQGKSTLMQILGTLEPACSGTIEIAGTVVNRFSINSIRNQTIAFVFQSFHLLDDETALGNVLMPAKIAREPTGSGSAAEKRALMLLEKVGLSEREHFQTKLLSGGEKQRVAIARAFMNDPTVLFADEPSGNLDSTNSNLIHSLLIEFSKLPGKALVVVTHNDELAKMCSSNYTLQNGLLAALDI